MVALKTVIASVASFMCNSFTQ